MVGLLSMAQSVDMFQQVIRHHGHQAIAQRVLELSAIAVERLSSTGATILNTWQDPNRSSIIVFTLPGVSPSVLRTAAIKHGVVLSCRGGGVRASIHAYNNESDLDRLIEAVRLCQKE